jgi:hypothetical protein
MSLSRWICRTLAVASLLLVLQSVLLSLLPSLSKSSRNSETSRLRYTEISTRTRDAHFSYGAELNLSVRCSPEMRKRYAFPVEGTDVTDSRWCHKMKKKYDVELGVSWGSLPVEDQHSWSRMNCDEVIRFGRLLSCSDRWGEQMLSHWNSTTIEIVKPFNSLSSSMLCKSSTQSSMCTLRNVALDFSKILTLNVQREFAKGFVETFGLRNASIDASSLFPINSWSHLEGRDISAGKCEVWEQRSTYIMSHDDIFNLGHHIEDVANVWVMLMLTQADVDSASDRMLPEALFVNVDGIRASGPAGGPRHRLMVKGDPDVLSNFSYYETWFRHVSAPFF